MSIVSNVISTVNNYIEYTVERVTEAAFVGVSMLTQALGPNTNRRYSQEFWNSWLEDVVSVQPMDRTTGQVFWMDYRYGSDDTYLGQQGSFLNIWNGHTMQRVFINKIVGEDIKYRIIRLNEYVNKEDMSKYTKQLR